MTFIEIYQNIAAVDENFKYWERADARGLELVFTDGGFAYPQYLNPDGAFDFERDKAIVQWYCVRRLEEMGYGRKVHLKIESGELRYAVELIDLNTGKIAYEPVFYLSELHATCQAYLSMLIYRDALEATAF